MSNLVWMLTMFTIFTGVVLALFFLMQHLRRKGYGTQMNALANEIERTQQKFLKSAGVFMGAKLPRKRGDRQHASKEENNTADTGC